jgi:phosphoglycolate phosphatase
MWKMPIIARHMRRLTEEQIDQISLFQGVDDMLQQLAEADITLAVVTSNSYNNVRHVLGPECAALISHYECGVSIFGKRARFRRILQRTGMQPGETLAIGDELRDSEAAQKERIPFGAVAWGFTHIAALAAQAPAKVFTKVDDIVTELT